MTAIANFYFDSRNPESYRLMGGYRFPVLETVMSKGYIDWYTVSTFTVTAKYNELDDLKALVSSPDVPYWFRPARGANIAIVENDPDAKIFLAYVKGNKLTLIRANGTFGQTGLVLMSEDGKGYSAFDVWTSMVDLKQREGTFGTYELLNRAWNMILGLKHPDIQYPSELVVDGWTQGSDPFGAKKEKRAGTIGRPSRQFAALPEIRTLIIPGGAHNDGWAVVNKRFIERCNEELRLPGFDPANKARLLEWFNRQMVYNLRGVGRHVNVETGLLIPGHAKTQAVMDDLGDEIDLVIPDIGIKAELRASDACDWAVMFVEPQGPKALYRDQQTWMNQQSFMSSVPEVRAIMKDERLKAMDELVQLKIADRMVKRGGDEFDRKFSWDFDRVAKLVQYSVSGVHAHAVEADEPGLRLADSPFLMKELGYQWARKMKFNPAVMLKVFRGEPNEQEQSFIEAWEQSLKIPVYNGRRMQVISMSAALMHSNPMIVLANGRNVPLRREMVQHNMERPVSFGPSKTPHVMVVSDWTWINIVIPSCGGCDLDDFFAVEAEKDQDRKTWLNGRNPNTKGEYVQLDYVEGDWHPTYELHDGTKMDFSVITKKRRPKQILQALRDGDTRYLVAPTEDPNMPDATAEDDRSAFNAFADKMGEWIKASGKPVPWMLAKRLPLKGIPTTDKDVLSLAKNAMRDEIREYLAEVDTYVKGLPIPTWLDEIGHNWLYDLAVEQLLESRREMYRATKAGRDWMEAQDRFLTGWIMSFNNEVERAHAIAALWLACLTTPTSAYSGSKITDQPIFGSGIYHHQDEEGRDVFPFLDAMKTLGVARIPKELKENSTVPVIKTDGRGHQITEYIRVEEKDPVVYLGGRRWAFTCTSCGTTFAPHDLDALVFFFNNNKKCSPCNQ